MQTKLHFTDFNNEELLMHGTGVLPSQEIRKCIRNGIVTAPKGIPEYQIQPASLDLRLGSIAYELYASFLPSGDLITRKIDKLGLCKKKIDLTSPVTLNSGYVYLVELQEEVRLPATVWGRANPRSTTGRADLFTRLLCDGSTEFDFVPEGYKGKLYAEIVPRTFTVRVQEGTRVNQLRFSRGTPLPSDKSIIDADRSEPLTFLKDGPTPIDVQKGLRVSVDLTPEDTSNIIGYKAKRTSPVLDFNCVKCHERFDFWEPISLNETRSLILQPDDFYILRSRQRVRIPSIFAAELEAFDPSFGEFRVHYAGFLDPGFGQIEGTPIVLEVRARDVPFLIEDGQLIGRVSYHRLLEMPDKIYGEGIGSSYQKQQLGLGKQFK